MSKIFENLCYATLIPHACISNFVFLIWFVAQSIAVIILIHPDSTTWPKYSCRISGRS